MIYSNPKDIAVHFRSDSESKKLLDALAKKYSSGSLSAFIYDVLMHWVVNHAEENKDLLQRFPKSTIGSIASISGEPEIPFRDILQQTKK